jgi:hypothetical protein
MKEDGLGRVRGTYTHGRENQLIMISWGYVKEELRVDEK